ncbi:hypothetical protein [Heyndrickxia coagulans]|uniref:hypothetical protein n=1 Tax=Heyndrickxia coagulans TaxID=1398 RepID=UPI001F2EE898|nr:hypothetical protein [Heyndrickxia coagulans]
MLKKFEERDFAILREPLESRQSPGTLAGVLLLAIFLQLLMYYLTYHVAARNTYFPNVNLIQKYHFWVTMILVSFSTFLIIPGIMTKLQKVQYLLSIFVSQNLFGLYSLFMGLFLIGENENIREQSLIMFTNIVICIGLFIFVFTSIRFYILLKKGEYRSGSKRDNIRGNLEKNIKSHFPTILTASVGLMFIIQYLFRYVGFDDIEEMFYTVLALLIFFTMMFVLPEQLVILYCKFRFKSFNFNTNGYLNPVPGNKNSSEE